MAKQRREYFLGIFFTYKISMFFWEVGKINFILFLKINMKYDGFVWIFLLLIFLFGHLYLYIYFLRDWLLQKHAKYIFLPKGRNF